MRSCDVRIGGRYVTAHAVAVTVLDRAEPAGTLGRFLVRFDGSGQEQVMAASILWRTQAEQRADADQARVAAGRLRDVCHRLGVTFIAEVCQRDAPGVAFDLHGHSYRQVILALTGADPGSLPILDDLRAEVGRHLGPGPRVQLAEQRGAAHCLCLPTPMALDLADRLAPAPAAHGALGELLG